MSSDACTLSYLTQSQIVINVLMFKVLLAALSVYQMLWPASNNNASLPCSNDFLKQVLAKGTFTRYDLSGRFLQIVCARSLTQNDLNV